MLPSLVLCRRDAQPGAADWGYVMPYLAIKNATMPSHLSSVGLGVGSYGLVWLCTPPPGGDGVQWPCVGVGQNGHRLLGMIVRPVRGVG